VKTRRRIVTFAVIAGILLLIAIGFGAGWITRSAGLTGALRQDLLRELMATSDAIETGLTLPELAARERRVRTADEMARDSLSPWQQKLVAKAIAGLSAARVAWRETFDECHNGGEWVRFFVNCNSSGLTEAFSVLKLPDPYVQQQMAKGGMTLRSNIMAPLLAECAVLTRAAVNGLRNP
jgi:hypothetical protein